MQVFGLQRSQRTYKLNTKGSSWLVDLNLLGANYCITVPLYPKSFNFESEFTQSDLRVHSFLEKCNH